MDKFTARRVVDEVMVAYASIERAVSIAESSNDVETKVGIIKGLLHAAGDLEDGPILKIVGLYPDLNPFSGKYKK